MKKSLILTITALVLAIALTGCSQQSVTPETSSSTASVSERKPEEKIAENSSSSLLAGNEISEVPIQHSQPANDDVQQNTNAPPKAQEPQLVEEKPSPKQKITPSPVSEQPQEEAPTPQPTKPPEPQQPAPAPTELTTPTFDVSGYVKYAKSYGQTIGLSLDSTATACWDNPTLASGNSKYLERDLKDLLDWYKASGFTAFWVWSEDLGNGDYNIYVGYA